VFADRVLSTYPEATGTVLDNGKILIERNRPDKRKTLVCASADEMDSLEKGAYDVVFFNWVLHHLVGRSHSESIDNICSALRRAKALLSPTGRISIFENMYDGQVIDWLPSRLIYRLTASKVLEPLTRRFGANTAGVGVCFVSKRGWDRIFADVGLQVLHYSDEPPWDIPLHRRVLLHLGPVRFGHYWCTPKEATARHDR
jgi:hypothetical protein